MDISEGLLARFTGSVVAVVFVIGLTACGGPPKWVTKGSGSYNEKDTKSFYGVGSVVGVKNEPLAWDTAQNRARAELAKSFETYTGYLMRDYSASTTAGDFTRNSEEQNVERAIKTITTVTLSGVRPIDQYKDDKTGTYYVLTKLSLEDMKDSLMRAKELNAEVRDYVRKNADRLFERLEKEEEKRGIGK
ncbi:MAG: LPP20 family lipoprotein [Nitrospiraceae bacterium]